MGVCFSIGAAGMTEDKLGDRCACGFVEPGGRSMPEQVGMEFFVDLEFIGNVTE